MRRGHQSLRWSHGFLEEVLDLGWQRRRAQFRRQWQWQFLQLAHCRRRQLHSSDGLVHSLDGKDHAPDELVVGDRHLLLQPHDVVRVLDEFEQPPEEALVQMVVVGILQHEPLQAEPALALSKHLRVVHLDPVHAIEPGHVVLHKRLLLVVEEPFVLAQWPLFCFRLFIQDGDCLLGHVARDTGDMVRDDAKVLQWVLRGHKGCTEEAQAGLHGSVPETNRMLQVGDAQATHSFRQTIVLGDLKTNFAQVNILRDQLIIGTPCTHGYPRYVRNHLADWLLPQVASVCVEEPGNLTEDIIVA